MANNIQGASKVDEIVNAWTKLEKVVTSNVEILERYSKSASSLPSDYVKQVEETRKAQEALNKALEEAKSKQKEYTNLVQAEERIIKKTAKVKADLAASTSKEAKEYHKLNEAKKAADKANRDEAKSLIKSVGLYNQVQQRINKLTKQYNDLATKKALGRKLNLDEEKSLVNLTKKLATYQNTLKKVDGDIGKHQRNVGNYKSAFNGLNVAVSQIGRELPAATVSMQTFFLGISNNIPMLQDEITKLINTNKQLAASGKPTVNVMKKLGGAVFSLTNLISLGTTLLVIYGKDVIDFASKAFEGSKSVNILKKEQESLNAAFESTELKDVIQNLFELQSTLELAKNGVVSKKEAVKKYNEVLGDNLGYVDDIETAEDNIVKKSGAFVKATLIKAAANHVAAEAAKALAENYKEELKTNETLDKQRARLEKNIEEKRGREAKAGRGTVSRLEGNKENIKKEGEEITEGYRKMYDKMLSDIKLLEDEFNFNLEGGNTDDDTKKRSTVEKLGFKTPEESAKEFQEYAKEIMDVLEKHFGVEAGKIDPIKLPPLDTEDFKVGLTKLQVATDEFIDRLSFSSIDQSPLSSLRTFFDGTFEDLILGANSTAEEFAITFNAIGEVAKQTFGMISDLSNQTFENELNNLNKQYENQLQFAGEGTAARERLEEQYEERRAVIQARQAKAQKEQALFNAGIVTFQSAIAAYASQLIPGDPTSIIRAQIAAGVAAAFGALQIGFIASQKIPQFWQGGITEGGQIMVNDDPLGIKGDNYKEVIKEPSGKLHFPQGKNVKMNVPKGSKVYPTYTDFNSELDKILDVNGINFKENVVDSRAQIVQVNNTGATALDMDRIIGKHFSNIKQMNIDFNERGIKKYLSKGNATTILHNNRTSGKGFSV